MTIKQVKPVLKLAPSFPDSHIHELQLYVAEAESSDLTSAAATTGVQIFEINPNILVAGFGWNCVTAWDANMMLELGTSTDTNKFGRLTYANLNTAGQGGVLWSWFEMIASDFAATGMNVIATFEQAGASAGEVNVYMIYKPGLGQAYFNRN